MERSNKIHVPILKPGKDRGDPASYRLIALTSTLCKLMQRMAKDRLMYYLENKGLLSRWQSGFRKGRSILDPTIGLEYEIRRAQIN